MRYCRLQYDGRYTWTDFPLHDIQGIYDAADVMRDAWVQTQREES